MALSGHHAASFLLLQPRTKQPLAPVAGWEVSLSLPPPARSAVALTDVRHVGRKMFGTNFGVRTHEVPAGARLCRQKKRTEERSSLQQWHCSVQEDSHILLSSSMEETYDALAERVMSAALTTDPSQKYMVGIAGPPGAGKSTVAQEVVLRLNELWLQSQGKEIIAGTGASPTDIAVAVPMDGFHLYRWQLDAMEDSKEAHARRGAHWTFDPASLLKSLQQLRSQGWAHLPSFDHGVGDPIEKDIFVTTKHKVVVVEGNYLLMEDGEWKGLSSLFDERWFVEIDIDEAMKRVEKRHIATGKTPESAKQRVVYNDRPNAELIALTKCNADLVIPSISVF